MDWKRDENGLLEVFRFSLLACPETAKKKYKTSYSGSKFEKIYLFLRGAGPCRASRLDEIRISLSHLHAEGFFKKYLVCNIQKLDLHCRLGADQKTPQYRFEIRIIRLYTIEDISSDSIVYLYCKSL